MKKLKLAVFGCFSLLSMGLNAQLGNFLGDSKGIVRDAGSNVSTGGDYVKYCSDNKWQDSVNKLVCYDAMASALRDARETVEHRFGSKAHQCWYAYYAMSGQQDSAFFFAFDKFYTTNPGKLDQKINAIAGDAILLEWPMPQACRV